MTTITMLLDKKFLIAPIALLTAACGNSGAIVAPKAEAVLPDYVASSNYNNSPIQLESDDVDQYLNQYNVQQVDLRKIEDRTAGYIFGFEFIPYWEFLWEDSTPGEGRGENGDLSGDQMFSTTGKINDYNSFSVNLDFPVEQYFDKDADGILLMCLSASSCGRSDFIKQILDKDFGYTNTYNIGGILEYNGKYKREI